MTNFSQFQNNINHALTAYNFSHNNLPESKNITKENPLIVSGFKFDKDSQIESIRVELGWAFFTRLDAIFEVYWSRLGIKKWADVTKQLKNHLNADEKNALDCARELRNIFHHEDGDLTLLSKPAKIVKFVKNKEPHLYKTHIKNFADLFMKCAKLLNNH